MTEIPFLSSLLTLIPRKKTPHLPEMSSRPFQPMTVAYHMGDDPGPKQAPRSFYIDDPGVKPC